MRQEIEKTCAGRASREYLYFSLVLIVFLIASVSRESASGAAQERAEIAGTQTDTATR